MFGLGIARWLLAPKTDDKAHRADGSRSRTFTAYLQDSFWLVREDASPPPPFQYGRRLRRWSCS